MMQILENHVQQLPKSDLRKSISIPSLIHEVGTEPKFIDDVLQQVKEGISFENAIVREIEHVKMEIFSVLISSDAKTFDQGIELLSKMCQSENKIHIYNYDIISDLLIENNILSKHKADEYKFASLLHEKASLKVVQRENALWEMQKNRKKEFEVHLIGE